eukprot:5711789-Alexandrium_andersonii.AAC.1
MSASLVGSEMCIRDRSPSETRQPPERPAEPWRAPGGSLESPGKLGVVPRISGQRCRDPDSSRDAQQSPGGFCKL